MRRILENWITFCRVAILCFVVVSVVKLHGQSQTAPMLWANPQFLDCSSGQCVPLSGGSVTTYVAGTTTPLQTCASAALSGSACTTANSNPIVLNSSGYNAAGSGNAGIWPLPNRCYKFVLQDINGSTVWTQDNVCGLQNAAQIGFTVTGGTVPITVASALNSAFLYDIGFATAALACANSSGKTIAVTSSALWSSLASMTCAAPLWFPTGTGVSVQPASGQTVTLTSCPSVGGTRTQAFDTSLGGTIVLPQSCDRWIGWFGAKENWYYGCTSGCTDDTAAIQAAVDSFQPNTSVNATGRLFFDGPVGVSNILFHSKGIEVVGCGAGGHAQVQGNPSPCAVYSTDTTGTKPIFTVESTQFMWMHGFRFYGYSVGSPTPAGIQLLTGSGAGANQQDRFSDIVIGPYADGTGVIAFVDGIQSAGSDGNDDSMVFENVITYAVTHCGINQAQLQNVNWTFTNVSAEYSGYGGFCIAAGGTINGTAMGHNAADIVFQVSADGAYTAPRLTVNDFSSETSLRIATTDGSGHAYPNLTINEMAWGMGADGVTPVNDGPCAAQTFSAVLAGTTTVIVPTASLTVGEAVTGTDIPANTTISSITDNNHLVLSHAATGSATTNLTFEWLQCSKLMNFDGIPGNYRLNNIQIVNANPAYQPMLDFSDTIEGTYGVDVDITEAVNQGAPLSQCVLIGFTSNGDASHNKHFRLNGSPDGSPGENWEYYGGGVYTGTVQHVVPVSGVIMRPDLFWTVLGNYSTPTDGCQGGVCLIDFSKGLVQTIHTGSNISSFTLTNLFGGGQAILNLTICNYSGGSITVANPYYWGGWGMGTVAANTCNQQLFQSSGRGTGMNAASAAQTGLAP